MTTSKWMHAGTMVKVNAINFPDKLGWQDKYKEYTFREWNERACRVANGLYGIGVGYQDRFAALAYNRGEWMDIYAGCAKGGQIIVPVMFRLAPPEVEYIVNHAECKGFIVERPFVEMIESIKDKLTVPNDAYIYLGEGPVPDGYRGYEDWLSQSSPEEPAVMIDGDDTWTFMYTSGTTGRPKGAIRTHEANHAQYVLNNINTGVMPADKYG